jgi:hypothetical protein
MLSRHANLSRVRRCRGSLRASARRSASQALSLWGQLPGCVQQSKPLQSYPWDALGRHRMHSSWVWAWNQEPRICFQTPSVGLPLEHLPSPRCVPQAVRSSQELLTKNRDAIAKAFAPDKKARARAPAFEERKSRSLDPDAASGPSAAPAAALAFSNPYCGDELIRLSSCALLTLVALHDGCSPRRRLRAWRRWTSSPCR